MPLRKYMIDYEAAARGAGARRVTYQPYRMSRSYMGDPFLGGLIGRAAGFLLPKAGKLIGKIFGGAKSGGTAAAAGAVLPGIGRIARGVGRAAGGVAGAVGTAVIAGKLLRGGDGERVRSRRIDYCNARALRRSVRRMEGFIKMYKRSVSALGYTVHRKGARPSAAFGGRKRRCA